MSRSRLLLTGAAFLGVAGCNLKGEIDVTTALLDRRYVLTTCITGANATDGTRSAPPCAMSFGPPGQTQAGTQTQIDSARMRVDQFHTSSFTAGTSTRPLGCATCAPSAEQVATYTGGYAVKPDSVVLFPTSSGFNGTSRIAFSGDIPATVKQDWFGPDSLVLQIAPGRFALFRAY